MHFKKANKQPFYLLIKQAETCLNRFEFLEDMRVSHY